MLIMAEYRSQFPWVAEPSRVLVIACSDGRWRAQTLDFVTNELGLDAHFHMVEVPGGVEPLTLLDLVPKDFNFLRRRVDMLVQLHRIRRIILVAHQDCGWYLQRKIGPMRVDLRSRQLADLKHVRARARDLFGDVAVETYYARLEGASQVVFEAVI
jgi:Putative carbonic anhydrase